MNVECLVMRRKAERLLRIWWGVYFKSCPEDRILVDYQGFRGLSSGIPVKRRRLRLRLRCFNQCQGLQLDNSSLFNPFRHTRQL